MRFRVATLNLWGTSEPLTSRLEVAGLGLDALACDAICLQEVRAGDVENTAAQLARGLGPAWHVVYECATKGPDGSEEGLAVLSRHRVLRSACERLPVPRADEVRIAVGAEIEHPGGARPWVWSTHLHWRLTDGVARELQVVALDDAVKKAAAASESVVVVAGDFNAAPDCDEIRFMRGRHTLGGKRTYWQDAFGRARPEERGLTWARRNPNLAMTHVEPDRRIDYVFVSAEKRGGVGRLMDARVVLDVAGDDGVFASDHFGVVADIEI